MTTEASLALIGATPPPDARRVEAIRTAIDLSDPDIARTFGERARLDVLSLTERVLAETRTSDLGECSGLLGHLRDRLDGLDPRRLEPPRGLAGWFSGRGGRLKQFREDFLATVRGVSEAAGDIVDRSDSINRRCTALDTLWSEARTAISELDAYIAAGAARLVEPAPVSAPVAVPAMGDAPTPIAASDEIAANPDDVVHHPAEPLPEPVTVAADVNPEATLPEEPVAAITAMEAPAREPEPESAMEVMVEAPTAPDPKPAVVAEAPPPEPAAINPGLAVPHPLAARLDALVAARNAALRQLPLVRLAQNADCRVPDRLKSVGEAVTGWREEWGDALGVNGKRTKRIKPDQVWLARERESLVGLIDAADRDIAAARERRVEAETRMETVAETVRRAA